MLVIFPDAAVSIDSAYSGELGSVEAYSGELGGVEAYSCEL